MNEQSVRVSVKSSSFTCRGNVFLALVLFAPGWSHHNMAVRTDVRETVLKVSPVSQQQQPMQSPPQSPSNSSAVPSGFPGVLPRSGASGALLRRNRALSDPFTLTRGLMREVNFESATWDFLMALPSPSSPMLNSANSPLIVPYSCPMHPPESGPAVLFVDEASLASCVCPKIIIKANEAVPGSNGSKSHIETFGQCGLLIGPLLSQLAKGQPVEVMCELDDLRNGAHDQGSVTLLSPPHPITRGRGAGESSSSGSMQAPATARGSREEAQQARKKNPCAGRIVLELQLLPHNVGGTNTSGSSSGEVEGDNQPYDPVFHVRVYAGINLPLMDEVQPSTFILLKTHEQQERGQCARSVTNVAKSTRNAVWRTEVATCINHAVADREKLFIALVDYPTKRYLFKCLISAKNIEPNKSYHYGLVCNKEGAYALMTVFRDPSPMDERILYEENPNLMKATFTNQRIYFGSPSKDGDTSEKPKDGPKEPLGLMIAAQPCYDTKAYLQIVKEALDDPMHQNVRKTPFKTVYHTNYEFDDPVAPESDVVLSFISDVAPEPTWAVPMEMVLDNKALCDAKDSGILFEFFKCNFVANPDQFMPGRRIVFYGYAIMPYSEIIEQLSMARSRTFTLKVEASRTLAEVNPFFEINVLFQEAKTYLRTLSSSAHPNASVSNVPAEIGTQMDPVTSSSDSSLASPVILPAANPTSSSSSASSSASSSSNPALTTSPIVSVLSPPVVQTSALPSESAMSSLHQRQHIQRGLTVSTTSDAPKFNDTKTSAALSSSFIIGKQLPSMTEQQDHAINMPYAEERRAPPVRSPSMGSIASMRRRYSNADGLMSEKSQEPQQLAKNKSTTFNAQQQQPDQIQLQQLPLHQQSQPHLFPRSSRSVEPTSPRSHRERNAPSPMRVREWQQQQQQQQIQQQQIQQQQLQQQQLQQQQQQQQQIQRQQHLSSQMLPVDENLVGVVQTEDQFVPPVGQTEYDRYLGSGTYNEPDAQFFQDQQQQQQQQQIAQYSLSETSLPYSNDQIIRQVPSQTPQFSSPISHSPGNVDDLKSTLHDYEIELASLRAINKQLTAENKHLRDVVAAHTTQYAQFAQLDRLRAMDKEELCMRLVNVTSTVQSLDGLLQSCYTQLLRLKRRKDDFTELERVVREQGSMLSFLREETSRIPYLEDVIARQPSIPTMGQQPPQQQPPPPQAPQQEPTQGYRGYGVMSSPQPSSNMTTPYSPSPSQEFAIPYAPSISAVVRPPSNMYSTISYSQSQIAQAQLGQPQPQPRPNFPVARPHSTERWDAPAFRTPLTPQPSQPLHSQRHPPQSPSPPGMYFQASSSTAPTSPIYASSMW